MKEILIVSPFTILPGEKGFNRFAYLSGELSERGHQVTLLTSNFSHAEKTFRGQDAVDAWKRSLNYRIVLLSEPGYHRNVGLDRIISHRRFEANLRVYLADLPDRPDLIYAAYPLMGSAFLSGMYAKRHGIPFILDIQDVWPEAINSVFRLPDSWVRALVYPFTIYANRVYRLADYVIGVSQTYIDRCRSANPNAGCYLPVFIGTDLDAFDRWAEQDVVKPEGEFWITYIGTLSYSYDIETVIRAVAKIHNRGYTQVRFKIFGSGPHEHRLQLLADRLKAPVDFMGHMPYDQMISYLVRSDLAVNAIQAGAMQSITNKIGDFLSAGLPILNSSLNREFSDMMNTRELGLNYRPGAPAELTDCIEWMLSNRGELLRFGANGRMLAEQKFNRRKTYTEIYQLLERL